jgi:hypothetical protein
MSTVVLPFPQKRLHSTGIPTPTNYQTGDVYFLLEFEEGDVLPVGFFVESKFYVRGGERRDGMLHALDMPAGVVLSRLRFLPNDRAISLPFMDGAPSGEMPVTALKIIGWVDEVRPDGWDGPRIVTLLDASAILTPPLPLYVTSPRL